MIIYASLNIHAHVLDRPGQRGCGLSQRVSRDTDDNEDYHPYIIVHRGMIASGELVAKNAVLKDYCTVAAEDSLLCTDMERNLRLLRFAQK
jgi:hypothetical protein